ncbi:MAG: hypothetical protein KJO79_02690 [Verrucomicrobiae bacterium]|nr:hypothetical protein [Verrucomicrobiae bacterium]NNJ86062.1 hypothetical protein [Akkermansiaceae bacterium]
MGKKKEDKAPEPVKKKGGCIKKLALLLLVCVMAYFGVHIYFLWQPAGKPDSISQSVMDANVAGVKVFPAIQAYPLDHVAGRTEILNGRSIPAPLLKERLRLAVERNYPLTLREEEINAWLSKRLAVKQTGALAPFVKVRGVWVDFKQDEIELIIEREFSPGLIHVTSMFMQFNRSKQGFSIARNSAQIGQVRAPGGFARLVMPAFSNMAAELADELKPYHDKKIRDVRVEDGKITFDPRKPEERL